MIIWGLQRYVRCKGLRFHNIKHTNSQKPRFAHNFAAFSEYTYLKRLARNYLCYYHQHIAYE